MRSEFYISFVKHMRLIPRKYEFHNHFFWTKFDLDELDELHNKTPIFSRNSFNLVSFYDNDHINLGYKTIKENIQAFLLDQGITEGIRKAELITNPRILGYTFNPVSFYFLETFSNSYLVIEIGNTFNEKKPFLVRPQHKTNDKWIFSTKKHFYISPFMSVENSMTFRIERNNQGLIINIDDYNKNGQLEMKVILNGKSRAWTTRNLIKLFISFPLITLRITASIHYHAFKLYLMRIPFWKKSDDDHLQKDHYVRKDKLFQRKI